METKTAKTSTKTCAICHAETTHLYSHHVTPKTKGGTHGEIAKCCRTCASQVHMFFNEKELAAMTFEELTATTQVKRYVQWKMQHPGDYTHRMANTVKTWKRYHR